MLTVQQTITADSALYGRMGQDMLKGSAVYQVGLRDVVVVRGGNVFDI